MRVREKLLPPSFNFFNQHKRDHFHFIARIKFNNPIQNTDWGAREIRERNEEEQKKLKTPPTKGS